MFSKYLQEIREQNGLTQKDLALKLGHKSRGTVAAWENDNGSPDPATIVNIKEALNCTYEELLEGKY